MVKVLLVDDHILFRRGLAALIADREGVEVIGEAGNGYEAMERAVALNPEVVLMDIQMPLCDGVQATRMMRERLPGIKVLILTVSEEDDHLFDAIKAGAHGYLLKNVQPEGLVQAITDVARGEAPISGAVAAKLLKEFSITSPDPISPSGDSRLSLREQEILALVARGASNKEIASRLVISEGTVKNHLHNILSKLHFRNRAEIAAYAVRQGIITPQDSPRAGGPKP